MKIIAITGSIGCGKTTIAQMFKKYGYQVEDLDEWVKNLYNQENFIDKIRLIFPEVFKNEVFDKKKLRDVVFSDNQKLKKLEALIHPFLEENFDKIIEINKDNKGFLFIDAALLFELEWDKKTDLVIVADVDYELQKKRVMERDGISAEDFEKINAVQMKNSEKIEKADIVINTGKNWEDLEKDIKFLVNGLEKLYG